MIQNANAYNSLDGVRVLVVEDDPLLAMDLEATLIGVGAVVVDLCRTLDQALARAGATISRSPFSISVLEPKRRRGSRDGWSTAACRLSSTQESRATNPA